MTGITYQRQFRTALSEAYIIVRDGKPFGRLDLHFGGTEVCGTLILLEEPREQELLQLISQLDDDLILSADTPREDLQLTVFQGRELLFYTDDLQQDATDK
ncbi:MAG: hypothetical protein M1296_00610 [Chloroflexi bacterium]|nr:hypothetical protein [Chloroflexota bacterium]